jgi:uncharacterized protein YjbJ (UPF0337 family)
VPSDLNQKETAMKWNLIEGDWRQFKGSVMRQWPKLTNVDVIIGKRARLAHYIQERCGYSKGETEKQLATWQGIQTESYPPALCPTG